MQARKQKAKHALPKSQEKKGKFANLRTKHFIPPGTENQNDRHWRLFSIDFELARHFSLKHQFSRSIFIFFYHKCSEALSVFRDTPASLALRLLS